jgi:hypothetical protein
MIMVYTEIVHCEFLIEALKKEGPKQRRAAERIEKLVQSNVNYVNGSLSADFPPVPFDTPIQVGGGDWDICVPERVRQLRKAGYTNVIPNRSISVSARDSKY